MKRYLFFLLTFWVCCFHSQAQDIRSQLQQLANDLSKQIEGKGKKRVVIASFLNLKNQETELGRYMADKFGIGFMKANTTLQLTDRSQLAQVLRDNKLGAERILDPKTIPTLGRLIGAEVIIIGNYTVLDNSLDVTVKAIDLERGLTLAVTEGTVPRTSEINRLLGEIDQVAVDPVPPPGDPGVKKDPDKKCATNHTGTYCFQNATKADIRIKTANADFTIHPGQTECNYGMHAGSQGEHNYNLYIYRNAKENKYESRQIVVSECQVKTYVIR